MNRPTMSLVTASILAVLSNGVAFSADVTVKVKHGNLSVTSADMAAAITLDQAGLSPAQIRVSPAAGTTVGGAPTPAVFSNFTRDVLLTFSAGGATIDLDGVDIPRDLRAKLGKVGSKLTLTGSHVGRHLNTRGGNGDDTVTLDASEVASKSSFLLGEGDNTVELKSSSRAGRSEERRVGKECRSRWSPYH